MAAFNPAMAAPMPRPAAYGAPAPMAVPGAPPGTFAPGTKIQVGNHRVVIQKYFSEGGFAHVYVVKLSKPIDGSDIAILKRVAVPDKENLGNMRTEVETMKKLKGHRPIVTYYDSHASQLKGGGYEVFLLMEFCNGGGLIDFMNTRLQNRLKEPEILKIFSDVTEGVACMHYLRPPLLHRDIKVENVLITTNGGFRRFKLCDFGSSAPPRPAAKTAAECRLIEEDVQKHTTLQYRSPEMIDVYRKQPIDEKSDIWALGVLLYKLCYYTTPFEEQGQLAILNASFKFPAHPPFSDRLKALIASMLRENPRARPTVYQVLKEACVMQGIQVPIKDIYANRTESEDRRNQQLPPITPNIASPPIVGAVYSPPVPQLAVIPDVVPMRRGRPTTNSQPVYAKSSNASLHGITSDPFAALDGQPATLTAKDEISARFPSLDQFSLLHDKGAKFEFETTTPHMPTTTKALNQRVTERLADEAFVTPVVPAKPSTVPQPAPGVTGGTSRAQQIITSNPALQVAISAPSAPQHTPAVVPGASRAQQIIANNPALQEAMSAPSAPSTNTISRQPTTMSQGTMTDLPSEPPTQAKRYTPSPIYRFPPADHHRSTSLPRSGAGSSSTEMRLRPDPILSRKDSIGRETNSASQPNLSTKQALSSRPSLEGGRPSSDFLETAARPHAIEPRVRPVTAYVESNLDYLRDKESAPAKSGFLHRHGAPQQVPTHAEGNGNRSDESDNVESEVEFLRQMEDDGRKDRRRNSGDKSAKRTSLPSISLSGTKNLLSGRFGDAFKRFENNGHSTSADQTHSPEQGLTRRELTPIAGSEATDGRSDDGHVLEETDDMSPEMKRELERRRLSMEERRVEAAAAEYRKRLAERPPGGDARSLGGMTKAASIQQKVQNLLDDNSKPSLVKKTAEGYGKYTDTASNSQSRMYAEKTTIPSPKPIVARKPIDVSAPYLKPATQTIPITQSLPHRAATIASRPTAPPKPTHLNSLPTGCAPMLAHALSNSPPKPRRIEPRMDMTQAERDDYISEFSKRFPSLTSIDMVETDVSTAPLNGGAGRGI